MFKCYLCVRDEHLTFSYHWKQYKITDIKVYVSLKDI